MRHLAAIAIIASLSFGAAASAQTSERQALAERYVQLSITGAIVGVGAAKRVSAVRWSVARSIVTAWFITMPAAAAIGAIFYFVGGFFLT